MNLPLASEGLIYITFEKKDTGILTFPTISYIIVGFL